VAHPERDTRLAALESNFFSQWSQFGRPEGFALIERDGLLAFETPIAALPYNGVFRTHLGADADAVIEATAAHFDERGAPFFWAVHPSATPDDLGARLERHGFNLAETATGMVARAENLAPIDAPPAGVLIRPVEPEDQDLVLEFVATRWSAPPDAMQHLRALFQATRIGQPDGTMRGWIASLDGAPVAKAFTHASPGVVGLCGVATKPEARGKGVARALCDVALRESPRPDTEHFVLHSSPMAESLYAKMGFDAVAPFQVYVRGAEFHI
jgi:GNAT superfamily N-acetyltransferase